MKHLATIHLEEKVMKLHKKGLNNAQIARRLGYTREYIRQIIYRKSLERIIIT